MFPRMISPAINNDNEFDEFGRRIIRPGIAGIPPSPTMIPEMIPQQNLQQASLPIFSQMQPPAAPVSHIPMAPASPAMMENIVPPRREDYQPSGFRNVMNAIAGGLAGASGGPQVGFQTGQALHDIPFNRAMQSYEVKTADQARRLGIEKERQRQAEFATSAATREEAVSSAVADKAENLKLKQADEERKKLETTSKIARQAALTRIGEAKLKAIPPHLQEAIDFSQMKPDEQDAITEAIAKLHPIKPNKTLEELEAESEAKTKGALKVQASPLGAAAARNPTVARTQGTLDVTTTPENIEKQAALTRAKNDATLTANQKQTRTGAIEILNQYPRIEKNLNNLISQKRLTNTLLTRWNEFMTGTLGTNDKSLADLRTDLTFLQSKLAQIHTTRTSNEVLKKFEGVMNHKVMTAETLKDTVNAAKNWIEGYAKDPRKLEEEYEKAHPEVQNITPSGHTFEVVKK